MFYFRYVILAMVILSGSGITFGMVAGSSSYQMLTRSRQFAGMLKKRQKKSAWYEKSTVRLRRKGAAYHFGKWITPGYMLFFDGLSGVIGCLVFIRFSVGLGVLLGVLFGLIPELLLEWMNMRDNERLLPELKTVYTALAIQIRAGLHVSDALQELYSCVREPRLYDAFMELAGDLCLKSDLFEAMNLLEQKFQNQYVDALCITVLQVTETGQAVDLLKDITDQIHGMEQSVNLRKKGALDRSITFYQLGMLGIVLGLALYSCVSYMLSSVNMF